MSESVKIRILADELKTSLGIFLKGHVIPSIIDTKKLRACRDKGEIEYINPDQTSLFES
jgi:hypothetical protein